MDVFVLPGGPAWVLLLLLLLLLLLVMLLLFVVDVGLLGTELLDAISAKPKTTNTTMIIEVILFNFIKISFLTKKRACIYIKVPFSFVCSFLIGLYLALQLGRIAVEQVDFPQ
jgi:hypothetical protein